ncbi:MAG: DUF1016 N-terminal domain-containing protein [Tannerellaceae bacterium]|jgi:hypothetical protein|nr:DUF1016 N-terminal domain-containing protein [Tannerellaceae bacterium]
MNIGVKHTGGKQYDVLVQQIFSLVNNAKKQAATVINRTLVETYWSIGKYIVEFEQEGNARVKYDDKLLVNLSKDLAVRIGKGYSRSNLFNMRLFYSRYPIFQTPSGKLSWSHIVELVTIDNELEHNFYLAKEKDEVMVQYAMYGNNNNLFVSKYQLYLPDLEELRNLVFNSFK